MEPRTRRHSVCSVFNMNLLFSLFLFILFCSLHSLPLVDTCGEKDCYDVLGLSNDANSTEIKKAFRKLSILHHPDKAPADQKEEASQKFIEISTAYQILNDDESRKKYDDLISGKTDGRKEDGAGPWANREYQPSYNLYDSSYTLPVTLTVIILTLGLPWLILSNKRNKRGRTVPVRSIPPTTSNKKEANKETKDLREPKEPKEPKETRKKQVTEELEIAQVTPGAPSYMTTELAQEVTEKEEQEIVEREWTQKDTELLIKASTRFPGGTKDRWLKIAQYVDRSVSEVLEKSKELTAKVKSKEKVDVPSVVHDASLSLSVAPELSTENQKPKKTQSSASVSSSISNPPSVQTSLTHPANPSPVALVASSNASADPSLLAEWSPEEQKSLEKALRTVNPKDPERWEKISIEVGSKTKEQCLARFKFISELLKKKKVDINREQK